MLTPFEEIIAENYTQREMDAIFPRVREEICESCANIMSLWGLLAAVGRDDPIVRQMARAQLHAAASRHAWQILQKLRKDQGHAA